MAGASASTKEEEKRGWSVPLAKDCLLALILSSSLSLSFLPSGPLSASQEGKHFPNAPNPHVIMSASAPPSHRPKQWDLWPILKLRLIPAGNVATETQPGF